LTPLARFLKSRPEVMQWIAIYFRSHACFPLLTLCNIDHKSKSAWLFWLFAFTAIYGNEQIDW
ncbi:hypothetical protein D5Q61_26210, partial [Escherichia coli]|nr:hypothetical protein [Escherichia coli]